MSLASVARSFDETRGVALVVEAPDGEAAGGEFFGGKMNRRGDRDYGREAVAVGQRDLEGALSSGRGTGDGDASGVAVEFANRFVEDAERDLLVGRAGHPLGVVGALRADGEEGKPAPHPPHVAAEVVADLAEAVVAV